MARILVIDDSPSVVAEIRAQLEPLGHQVDALVRFVDLSVKLRDGRPDVIVLDLEMPALSGEAVSKYIRKYSSRPIPILIYSSADEEALKGAAGRIGALSFVRKGASPAAFLSALNQILRYAVPV
jgi:CheY-like chemotaxis protein